jgi:hypothetical protein
VGYQICFEKAGSGLIPLLEGADGDLLLEQGPCSRCGEAPLASFTLRTQQTIRCSGAHAKELVTALIRDLKVLMPLQRFKQGRKKGDEPFSADAIGSVPGQEQRVLDLRSISAQTGALRCMLHLLGVVEEPHCILAIVSSRSSKCIK